MEDNKQELVSTFLEITMSNCRNSALNILEDAGWNFEAAIQLFFEGVSSHGESTMLPSNSTFDFDSTIIPTGWGSEDEDEVDDGRMHFDVDASVQPIGWDMKDEIEVEYQECNDTEHSVDGPLGNRIPVIDERLYNDDSEFYRLETNDGTAEDSDWKEEGFNETNLSMLYRRPICLMFYGNFHEAKAEASHRDRWLLVNVQASVQFNSQLLNRDTWSNVTVQEILRSHFVFWQINQEDIEGQKVCCFYKLKTLPATMVIDPITGEKLFAFQGMKQPEDLLEDLIRFSDKSPKEHLTASTRKEDANASTNHTVANEASQPKETSPVSTTNPSYPPLPEEPTEKKLICTVGICLPSGQRVQRSFLKTDSTKLLWSFCSTLLKEEESQSFCFLDPSSSKLFYSKDASFEEAGLSNALLRLCLGGDN